MKRTIGLILFCLYASSAKIIGRLFWGFESKNWQSLYKGLWLESASWINNVR